jgi:hypothetical protein
MILFFVNGTFVFSERKKAMWSVCPTIYIEWIRARLHLSGAQRRWA